MQVNNNKEALFVPSLALEILTFVRFTSEVFYAINTSKSVITS